jgi:GIY-YIG catalytic domain
MSLLRTAGIYAVENLQSGRIYIGQSVDLRKRSAMHFTQLKRGKHFCLELQADYNKLGRDFFKFKVLKKCKDNPYILQRLEKSYITTNLSLGISLYNKKYTPTIVLQRLKTTPYSIRNLHTGERYEGSNVAKLSRELGVDSSSIFHLLSGKVRAVSPTTYRSILYVLSKNYKEYKTYKLVSPKNKIIITKALGQVCLLYNLEIEKLREVIQGKRKSTLGWTIPKNLTPNLKVINPRGNKVKVPNLYSFCFKYGLKPSLMISLIEGKCKIYRGWKYER